MGGHGKVQRLLLAILRQHERARSPKQRTKGLDVNWLTRLVQRRRYPNRPGPVTPREKESVRRALNVLAREGVVLRVPTPDGKRSTWRINPLHPGRQSAP